MYTLYSLYNTVRRLQYDIVVLLCVCGHWIVYLSISVGACVDLIELILRYFHHKVNPDIFYHEVNLEQEGHLDGLPQYN